MKTRGSALVFSIILMAAITILGLAAFTMLYHNYLEVTKRNDTYFIELEEHVIAQEIYVTIVLDELVDPSFYVEGPYGVEIDGTEYLLEYDSGSVSYSTGTMTVRVDSDYQIEQWFIINNQEE